MSLLWVAKQLPPRLNNQQLLPVSARVKGCAGLPGGHGASAVRSPPSGPPPPPHSPPMLPWAPAEKAPIPPKSRWKTKVRALRRRPGRARCGEEDCGPERGREAGRGCVAAPPCTSLDLPVPSTDARSAGTASLRRHPAPSPEAHPPLIPPAPDTLCLSFPERALPRRSPLQRQPRWYRGEPGWLPHRRRQLRSSLPLYSPELFLCFVLFLPHLLCCQLFLSPGANL